MRNTEYDMLRLKEVLRITKLSRATIYRMMSEGRFPEQKKIGKRAVGWRMSEIIEYIENLS